MHLYTASLRWTAAVGILLVALYAGGLAWAFETKSYNVWGSMLVGPLVLVVDIVLLVWVSRRVADRWLIRVMSAGLALKVLGSAARYYFAFVVYGGAADANRYSDYASFAYRYWRRGFLVWDVPAGGIVGTPFMDVLTTAVYTVTGPSPIAGFLVYASFAYWGAYLIYRAFCIAVPDGNHRRYALLLFLLPSMLYWPSSIGKESFLMLTIGATALGGAKFFAKRPGALPILAVGLAGTLLVRPHFAALMVAGMFVGQLFRPLGKQAIEIFPRIGGVVAIILVGAFVVGQSAEFLGIDTITTESVGQELETAGENTQQGGSEFTPVPLTSPLGLPASLVTVLFRPFPWEAHNIQVLATSLEGLFLMGLLVASWRQLKQVPRLIRTNPYVTFCLAYTLFFIWAFSSFGNFGILTRERILVMPFFLILVALPLGPEVRAGRTGEVNSTDEVSTGEVNSRGS